MAVKERQHSDLRDWVGESHSMRAVVAASALEDTREGFHFGASLEKDLRRHEHIDSLKAKFHLQGPSRLDRIEVDNEWLDAIVATITAHADVVASRLKMTPDQLYSITFADFVNKYEQSKGSAESKEPPERQSLVERLDEAYDEDAEQEDEEFFRTTQSYYRRRFHAED